MTQDEYIKLLEAERFDTSYLRQGLDEKKKAREQMNQFYYHLGRYSAGVRDSKANLAHQKHQMMKERSQ